jgi:hypothetical protein
MNAKNRKPMYEQHHSGPVMRLVQPVQREPARPRLATQRAWVTEGSRFDEPIPDITARGETNLEHFQYERVSVEEVRMARGRESIFDPPDNLRRSRPRSPAEPLEDETMRWLTRLPETQRPLGLARMFPRIANKLCRLWSDSQACDRYVSELLMDTRDGARQGFPMAVAAELAALLGTDQTSDKDLPWGQVNEIR